MPLNCTCERCGRSFASKQFATLCAGCDERLGEEIDIVLMEIDGEEPLGGAGEDLGECSYCNAKLIPYDGGGGAYCPNGCSL